MSEELFPYYESELAFLRKLGDRFAREHPSAGGALLMGQSVGEARRDPHVERLLQGVALMNARIRHRLDDDFPQLSETLLNTLYPHYLAPFPSCAIAQFHLDEGQLGPDAAKGIAFKSGGTCLEIREPGRGGAPLRFQTAYPVQLLPIRIVAAGFRNVQFESPPGTRPREAVAALQLELNTLSAEIAFADIATQAFVGEDFSGADSKNLLLRIFLHGSLETVHGLYDQFLRSLIRLVVSDPLNRQSSICLPAGAVSSVGFGEDETLLPRNARIMHGYRLLHEYFAFPQKFHFVNIRLPRSFLKDCGTKLNLHFMTSEENPELSEVLSPNNLKLGCAPVVNLFPMRVQFARSFRQTEYPLIVEAEAPLDYEIFSVQDVRCIQHGREVGAFRSFYDVYHGTRKHETTLGFWHAARRSATLTGGRESHQDVYLSLTDHAVDRTIQENSTIVVDVVCLNRNSLSDGIGSNNVAIRAAQAKVQLVSESAGGARLITLPTSIQRQRAGHDWRWQLCSHLALNHLSLADVAGQGAALKELLWLYNTSELATDRERIEGIDSVQIESERITKRVAPGPFGFARGNRVTLAFREAAYTDGGLFLFASVLRSFLAAYVTINSFVETRYRTIERKAEFTSWPALSGTRPLL